LNSGAGENTKLRSTVQLLNYQSIAGLVFDGCDKSPKKRQPAPAQKPL
jgi:hypothetical protein